jgi:hypothetical protein
MLLRLLPSLLIAAFSSLALAACGGSSSSGNQSDQAKAVTEAKAAFAQFEKSGADLSAGPCISESLPSLPDWVADIAHDPRQPIDDEPQNQCQRYRSGQAHHFVELTPQGELIRAQ